MKLSQTVKKLLDFCLSEEPLITNESQEYTCQQLCARIVYSTILEIANDSFHLTNQGHNVSSAALLRSLFEYFIELLFIAKDSGNLMQRNLDAQKEQQKLLRAMENSKDPSLNKFKNDEKFEPRKKELEDSLCGHSSKSIWNLCDEVGYVWMYDMVYRTLSQVVHPNIVNYNCRFFKEITPNSFEYNPSPKLGDEEKTQRYVLLLEILIKSTSCVHEIFSESKNPAIEEQLDKFTKEALEITK